MATAYAVLALEMAGALESLDPAHKDAAVKFLLAGLQPGGSFKDPLFNPQKEADPRYGAEYFMEETTTFCQQALDALGAPTPVYRQSPAGLTARSAVGYLESLEWKNPWRDANRFLFAFSQMAWGIERHGRKKDLEAMDAALDWVVKRLDAKTGLWGGPHPASLVHQMAATVHFTYFFAYRDRPVPYADKVIDSCLKLQQRDGLFNTDGVGHGCFDADAVDLMLKAARFTDHRKGEIKKSLRRAYGAIQKLVNPDGGYAHCKKRFSKPFGVKLPLPAKAVRGDYECPGKFLSCKSAESNAFSTWFRLIAASEIEASEGRGENRRFRRLPFLGYH